MAPGSTRLVVDTDVLIDYLRDQEQAVGFLEGCEQALAISVSTSPSCTPECATALNASSSMALWRPLRYWRCPGRLLLWRGCGDGNTAGAMARAWPMR